MVSETAGTRASLPPLISLLGPAYKLQLLLSFSFVTGEGIRPLQIPQMKKDFLPARRMAQRKVVSCLWGMRE